MSRSLPPRPSMRYLHTQAKGLHKAHAAHDASCCPTLRGLHRFSGQSDEDILSATIKLTEVQFALAVDYGFKNWEALTRHVNMLAGGIAFKDPRAASMRFTGDVARDDTCAMAMTVALRAMGIPADDARVRLLAGNGFAPDLRPAEPCRVSWRLQGRDRCLEIIAAAYGVSLRPFPSAAELLEDIPPRQRDPDDDTCPCHDSRQPAAAYLRHALHAGEVVVSCGEWQAEDVFWCDWGLVTEARDDGTILGAASNGRDNNRITFIRDGWILSPGAHTVDSNDIDKMVLARAAQRIRGDSPPFGPGPRNIVFGVAAMDVWIAAMQEVPFDGQHPDGHEGSIHCAAATALPTFLGAKHSANDLRAMAKRLAPPAARALHAAAEQYDAIVALLAPALTGDAPDNYASIMGDASKQAHHADAVLKPIRDHLSRASDHMSSALSELT